MGPVSIGLNAQSQKSKSMLL